LFFLRTLSHWPSQKAKQVFRALISIGWKVKTTKASSHVQLEKEGFADFTWAFNDSVEIGPKMLSRIAKKTGLKREDL
jgi:predicted RNA binding protein YcfA (HicA-like mRNA interferase family)